MIHVNELRIGNYVSFKGLWNGIVDNVDNYFIGIKGQSLSVFPVDAFRGIPLTPEILEKAGFKSISNHIYLSADALNLATIEYKEDEGICYLDFEGTQTGVDIKYVHQLQNLYFALTGEELEITL